MGALATPSGGTANRRGITPVFQLGAGEPAVTRFSTPDVPRQRHSGLEPWQTNRGGDPPQGMHKYRNRSVWPDYVNPQTSAFMTVISNSGPLMIKDQSNCWCVHFKQLMVGLNTLKPFCEHSS